MASLRDLGFRRVSVRGHYQYQQIGGGFVSRARVERAKTRAAAVEAAVERDRAAAVREARRSERAPAVRRVERRPAPPTLPEPVHRERGRKPPALLPPPAPPVRRPRRGEVSEESRGPWRLRGTAYKYRDARGRYVSKATYQKLPRRQRGRREQVTIQAAGVSARAMPLVEALQELMADGVPWQGVPDTYRASAVRLALVEPTEETEGVVEKEPDEDADEETGEET